MLSKLDTTKATSVEDFPTWLSLDAKDDICVPVCDIINTMLITTEFPDMWKRAQINPIPKVSSPAQLKDYRPISLLFHLGKLSEEVIINKMRSHLECIIEPSQFAYQPKLGTVDAIIQLLEDFTEQLDKPEIKYIQSAALDFSKAFDCLQPAILVNKMWQYNFNSNITALVRAFLKNRSQCVKYGENHSKYVSNEVGAPQGTKLGPILWLIYSNDLAADGFKHIKYADDTTFYTPSNNHTDQLSIASAITTTTSWSADNNMMLNTNKTVLMNTSLSCQLAYNDSVNIDGVMIAPSINTMFLGILIDNKLSFNDHVATIVNKCNSRLFLMRKLKAIGLSVVGLKLFYTTNIRSIICYAAPSWFTYLRKTNKDTLERLQRTATRIILPDKSYEERLHELQLPLINDFLFTLSASHFNKILNNPAHPLHSRIIFNKCRTSSRAPTRFKPKRCKTSKRGDSFFNVFMNSFNKSTTYIL